MFLFYIIFDIIILKWVITLKKVVVIGGGHGLSVLLKGLKLFPVDITAIVTVADDGSSSGKLREEFDMPAVGDLRNVLVALSEVEPLVEQLLQYRFKTDNDFNNHPLGNLLLAALYNITGELTDSLESLTKILNIKGKVLPFTEDKAILVAHTSDGVIEGESKITKAGKHIEYVEYKNEVRATDEVITALEEADYIIFGLGSLYTSIIPNLLDKRVKETIKKSKAKKMYVCNAMTEHGETDGFKVSDCIKQLEFYLGDNVIDVVVANNKYIDTDIQELYLTEKATPILIDKDNIKKLGVELIEEPLVVINNNQVRHDPLKTALAIFTYISSED